MSKQMVVQSGCSGLTVTVVLAWSSDFPKTHERQRASTNLCSSFASALRLKHWSDSSWSGLGVGVGEYFRVRLGPGPAGREDPAAANGVRDTGRARGVQQLGELR